MLSFSLEDSQFIPILFQQNKAYKVPENKDVLT